MKIEEVTPVLSVSEKHNKTNNYSEHKNTRSEKPVLAHSLKNGKTTLQRLPQTGISNTYVAGTWLGVGMFLLAIYFMLRRCIHG